MTRPVRAAPQLSERRSPHTSHGPSVPDPAKRDFQSVEWQGACRAAEEEPVSEQAARDGRRDGDPRTTAVLMLGAIREASTHLGMLLRLARTEIRGNLRALAALVALFGGALLLVLTSLVLLLLALRDALAALIGSEALAALIVALPFVVIAAILVLMSLQKLSLRSPEA